MLVAFSVARSRSQLLATVCYELATAANIEDRGLCQLQYEN